MVLVLAELPNWLIGLAVSAFFVLCIILILTVLIQRPQGGGLSGAFGSGAGSGQTAFGAKTGDALTVATIGLFVVYLLVAIGLNYAVRPSLAATATPVVAPAEGEDSGAAPAQPATGAAPQPATTTPTTTTPPSAPATPAGDAPKPADPAATSSPVAPPPGSGAGEPKPANAEPATQPPAQPATPPNTAPPTGGPGGGGI